MIIRAKTFRAWMRANFDNSYLHDMVTHGCIGGFPGLTYYTDTAKLYRRFSGEIWDMLTEAAEEFDAANVFEYIAGFTHAKDVGGVTQAENLLVWYAAERIAAQLVGEV